MNRKGSGIHGNETDIGSFNLAFRFSEHRWSAALEPRRSNEESLRICGVDEASLECESEGSRVIGRPLASIRGRCHVS